MRRRRTSSWEGEEWIVAQENREPDGAKKD
jgi:hypothetical protein